MSNAYHSQSDGQKEVVNCCLEQYLRCFVLEQPTKWSTYLLWAELCYNTSYHSSLLMSPFEAVFGKPPPVLSSYVLGSSTIEAVDHWLFDRDEVLHALRDNLRRAQIRMKAHADKRRREMHFHVGQWCYIKLQPHRQISVSGQRFTKLSKWIYGPFKIIKRIGPVAYKLNLPKHCKIHLIFHISVLKLCPNPDMDPPIVLPSSVIGNQTLVLPLAVLSSRIVKRGSVEVPQVLVQWDGLPLENTSWEDLPNFKAIPCISPWGQGGTWWGVG